MALTGLAIAAAIGLAKNEFVDKPAADRAKKISCFHPAKFAVDFRFTKHSQCKNQMLWEL